MDKQPETDRPADQSRTPPELRDADESVGGDGEPVGEDNIRDGTVRGTIHGGPTASEGQGQGG